MRTDPRPEEVRRIVETMFFELSLYTSWAEETDETVELGGDVPRLRIYSEEDDEVAAGSRGTTVPRTRCTGISARSTPKRGGSRRFSRLNSPWCQETAAADGEIEETVLIDSGRCVARSYRARGLLAMWLIAAGVVQFYAADGRMLATVNLFQTLRPQRIAA